MKVGHEINNTAGNIFKYKFIYCVKLFLFTVFVVLLMFVLRY